MNNCRPQQSLPKIKQQIKHARVSYQLTGRKGKPRFSAIKFPYRMHSDLNTVPRL